MQGIPLIDMSVWHTGSEAEKDRLAREVDAACRTWGFLMVKGHGLDPDLTERIRDVTRAFFDLPVETKLLADSAGRPGGRGYYRVASKSHARTRGQADAPGDLRETYFAGVEAVPGDAYCTQDAARGHFAANVWPAEPAGMGAVWTGYMLACHGIAASLLQISARALGLADNWFDGRIDRPVSTLTAQHYPKLDRTPEPGQVRSGAHIDFGTVTLLLTEDRPGGLQVQTLEGEWIDVRPIPGAFIVNLGDMMARWTNDRWRSTLHRVVNPPADAGAAARRLSIVYFHMPNFDAVIECIPTCVDGDNPPRYEPILAGEHLAEKLRRTNSVAARPAVDAKQPVAG